MNFMQRINNGKLPPLIHVPEIKGAFDPAACSPTDKHYPYRTDGIYTALVCGTAKCLTADFARAIDKRRCITVDDICLVNEAAGVLRGGYIATCHPEKLPWFKALHEDFSGDEPIEYHSQDKRAGQEVVDEAYYWNIQSGAGSAIFAVKVMLALGYKEVIMCGCPMNGGGGYINDETTGASTPSDPRFGYEKDGSQLIEGWHKNLRTLSDDPVFKERVFSMSGLTRDLFGEPQ